MFALGSFKVFLPFLLAVLLYVETGDEHFFQVLQLYCFCQFFLRSITIEHFQEVVGKAYLEELGVEGLPMVHLHVVDALV